MFQEGKVKTYHADRGFGFIQIEGEKRIYFFILRIFRIKISRLNQVKQLNLELLKRMGNLKQITLSASIFNINKQTQMSSVSMMIYRYRRLHVMAQPKLP